MTGRCQEASLALGEETVTGIVNNPTEKVRKALDGAG